MVGKVNFKGPELHVLEVFCAESFAVLIGSDCVDEPSAAVFDKVVYAFGPDESSAEPVAGEGFASVESVQNVLVKFCHNDLPSVMEMAGDSFPITKT